MHRFATAFLIIFSGFLFPALLISQTHFVFPLDGAVQLNGTYGELREDHFHAGIDIRTPQIGMKVFAASKGYVYRIRVDEDGYGKCIYLKHPDGFTTVYAHLQDFADPYADEVRKKQYASRKYEVDIHFSPDRFPVDAGRLIAYSGNTGHSAGAHLHFEVRDPRNRIVDPARFMPGVVSDHASPLIQKIVIVPLTIRSRINGSFSRLEIPVVQEDDEYTVPDTIRITDAAGIGFLGYDRLDSTRNPVGINYAELWLDDTLYFSYALDGFSFDETRCINVHFDYREYKASRRRFERMYLAPGNHLDVYQGRQPKGVLLPSEDDAVHRFRLIFHDLNGNLTVVRGYLKRDETPSALPPVQPVLPPSELSWEVIRNILVIRIKYPLAAHREGLLLHFPDGRNLPLLPVSATPGEWQCLYDMSSGDFPSGVTDPHGRKQASFPFIAWLDPARNNPVKTEGLQLFFPVDCLFDSLVLAVRQGPREKGAWSPVWRIGDPGDPLFRPFVLHLDADTGAPEDRLFVARKNEKGAWEFCGRDFADDGMMLAASGVFGTFCLMSDIQAPRVTPSGFQEGARVPDAAGSLSFRITDDLSGIDPARLLLMVDGKWELCEWDSKNAAAAWRWEGRPSPGKHFLSLMVYDRTGNLTTLNLTLQF